MQTHAIDLEALGRRPAASLSDAETALSIERLNLFYGGDVQALYDINLEVKAGMITSLIGPSGCRSPLFCAASTASTSVWVMYVPRAGSM